MFRNLYEMNLKSSGKVKEPVEPLPDLPPCVSPCETIYMQIMEFLLDVKAIAVEHPHFPQKDILYCLCSLCSPCFVLFVLYLFYMFYFFICFICLFYCFVFLFYFCFI